MFGKKSPENFPLTDALRYQEASDQITDAGIFIAEKYDDLRLSGVHPLHASDVTSVQLVFAGIAQVNDRIAEALIRKGETSKNQDTLGSTADITSFATALSENAQLHLDNARSLNETQTEVEFDDETRNNLFVEAQLPYWPVTDSSLQPEEWQDEQPGAPQATSRFIEAIMEVTVDLQAEAADRLQHVTDATRNGQPLPPEYEALSLVVQENFLDSSMEDFRQAEAMLTQGFDDAPAEYRHRIYVYAHDALTRAADACSAATCPSILGDDWLPQRS